MDLAQSPWGKLFEKARNDQGLSQKRAADIAGVSDKCWRDNEKGWRLVGGEWTLTGGRAATLAAMAKAVDVTPAQLRTLKLSKPWTKPVHLDAARVLERLLAAEKPRQDTKEPQRDKENAEQETPLGHEQWLRATRETYPTLAGFLEYVMTVTGDIAPNGRKVTDAKGSSR